MTREEVIQKLEAGDKNFKICNLSGLNLCGANLCGADIDYACWPLWCGGLHVKIDKRIACQLAYHFCNQDCDDPEYIEACNAILDFANQFHRATECGFLEPRDARWTILNPVTTFAAP